MCECDYCYIPTHLIAQVLLRLPFDSLIRFRCVSRSWRDLIDSPFFAQMHSKRSRQLIIKQNPHPHPESKIVVLEGNLLYTFDWVFDSVKAINARELKGLPLGIRNLGLGLDFVGSSDGGILCLWSFPTDNLFLWNPWIHKYSALPPPPVECTKKRRLFRHAAFGYDHINDDYKVVKWHIDSDDKDFPHSGRYELGVYSLKLNSWRRVKGSLPFELPQPHWLFCEDCTVLNGALHWLVTDWTRGIKIFIVAFDLGTEEFRKMSCDPFSGSTIPHAIPQHTHKHQRKLCALNGSLSLIFYYTTQEERRPHGEIWMMEDYGVVASSWTKLTSIDFPRQYPRIMYDFNPIAFSKKRRKVLLQVTWEKLVLYDLDNKSFTDVAVTGRPNFLAYYCICVGGLVSPCSYCPVPAAID